MNHEPEQSCSLPGDGIGVEVTARSRRACCNACGAQNIGHRRCELERKALLGGIAIHKTGTPLPEDTTKMALDADATLMGAVGLPEFDNAPPEKRPENGLARDSQDAGRVCEFAAGAGVASR